MRKLMRVQTMVDKKDAPFNKIFKAAMKLIENNGYNEVTMESIADEAGIDVGLINKHFPEGKLAILRGFFHNQSSEVLEKVDFNIVTIENLAQSLKFLLRLYIQAHRDTAALISALEVAFLTNKEKFHGYEDIFTIELAAAPLLSQVLKQLGFREGKDFDELVRLIIHTLDSLVHRHVIFSNIVEDDNILIDFLISLSVGFINYSVQFQKKKRRSF